MREASQTQAEPSGPGLLSGPGGMALVLLTLAYTFNFIDRTIISTVGQAIKADLRISDTQLGLLGGLYFALLYTVLAIPIARLAERYSRVNIIAASLVVWSGFTVLCGLAQSFAMLAAFRFGVGVGEAGCTPAAHSLISDFHAARRRASALAVYAFGNPLGSLFGAVAGGWLAQAFSWRMAFLVVGLPGVLLGILIKAVMREPPRGGGEASAAPPAPFSLSGEIRELAAVARVLFGKGPVRHMIFGATIASFGLNGISQFAPPWFNRAFGLDYAQVGLIIGLAGGLSSGVGALAGGFISDRLSRRGAAWYALTPALGLAIAAPLYAAVYLQASWQAAAALLMLPGLFLYTFLAPTFAVIQNSVEVRRRATATALMFFFLNLIAQGGGPPFVGALIDHLGQVFFTRPDLHGPLQAFGALLTGQGGGPDFAAACPGGRPAPGGAVSAAACHAALTSGTQAGLLATLAFYLWAAVHFLIGAFGLSGTLARARAGRSGSDPD